MIKEQQNNPLHGLKLEVLLTELVEFYGWEILATALRFHCFKTNPSIEGSLTFLRKTEWARAKLEDFYLYRFKRMPKPDPQEYELAPRERGFAPGLVAREPMILTVESIELSQAKAASQFKAQNSKDKVRHKPEQGTDRNRKHQADHQENKAAPSDDPANPWGKLK